MKESILKSSSNFLNTQESIRTDASWDGSDNHMMIKPVFASSLKNLFDVKPFISDDESDDRESDSEL